MIGSPCLSAASTTFGLSPGVTMNVAPASCGLGYLFRCQDRSGAKQHVRPFLSDMRDRFCGCIRPEGDFGDGEAAGIKGVAQGERIPNVLDNDYGNDSQRRHPSVESVRL